MKPRDGWPIIWGDKWQRSKQVLWLGRPWEQVTSVDISLSGFIPQQYFLSIIMLFQNTSIQRLPTELKLKCKYKRTREVKKLRPDFISFWRSKTMMTAQPLHAVEFKDLYGIFDISPMPYYTEKVGLIQRRYMHKYLHQCEASKRS
jgi:hypothetical protein